MAELLGPKVVGIVKAVSVRDRGHGVVVVRLRREDSPKDPGRGHVCTGSFRCDGDVVDCEGLDAWFRSCGVPVRATLTADPTRFGAYCHAEFELTRPATAAQGDP